MRLGVWEQFLADAHEPSPGTIAVWGDGEPYENHFVFHPHGRGWHLDRARFDRMLAAAAAERGVAVRIDARVTAVERQPGGWAIDAAGSGRRIALPRAVSARRIGAPGRHRSPPRRATDQPRQAGRPLSAPYPRRDTGERRSPHPRRGDIPGLVVLGVASWIAVDRRVHDRRRSPAAAVVLAQVLAHPCSRCAMDESPPFGVPRWRRAAPFRRWQLVARAGRRFRLAGRRRCRPGFRSALVGRAFRGL